jgi:hypothetical protein
MLMPCWTKRVMRSWRGSDDDNRFSRVGDENHNSQNSGVQGAKTLGLNNPQFPNADWGNIDLQEMMMKIFKKQKASQTIQ